MGPWLLGRCMGCALRHSSPRHLVGYSARSMGTFKTPYTANTSDPLRCVELQETCCADEDPSQFSLDVPIPDQENKNRCQIPGNFSRCAFLNI